MVIKQFSWEGNSKLFKRNPIKSMVVLLCAQQAILLSMVNSIVRNSDLETNRREEFSIIALPVFIFSS